MSWKEASTIILTAFKKAPVKANWNYLVLTLKRSSKSSFMPNGCVFPGGTTEPSDSNKEWLDIFSKFNINTKSVNAGKTIPPIIANNRGYIPKLLSLKITAVRETFEETGILLCFCKNQSNDDWISYKSIEDLDLWRSKVQKDSSEFLNLCLENNCCPDVNNLHLWSNWLTPSSMGNKRFDTAFFIACLKDLPAAEADKKEAQILNWSTPEELLSLCSKEEIWLPPPQVYENSRLLNFKDISELKSFSIERSKNGCEIWMPIQMKTKDGSVSVLPGDEAYDFKDFMTPTKPLEVNFTNEEFRSQLKVLHRMEFKKKIQTKVVHKNYNPTNGHKLPVTNCKKTKFVNFMSV